MNRALQIALSGLQGIDAFLYVDDILLASRTYSEHLEKLDRVLTRLEEARFVLRPSKCSFMQRQSKYLGHIIDENTVFDQTHPKFKLSKTFPVPLM